MSGTSEPEKLFDVELETEGRNGPVLCDEQVCRFVKRAPVAKKAHRRADGTIHESRFITKKELTATGVSVVHLSFVDASGLQERADRMCRSQFNEIVDAHAIFDVGAVRGIQQRDDRKRLLLVLDEPVDGAEDHAHAVIVLTPERRDSDEDVLEARTGLMKLIQYRSV